MFSKNAPDEDRGKSWSLATRLSVWYAGSAFLLLLIAAAFLYLVLVNIFNREDDQHLAEKIDIVRSLLLKHGASSDILKWEVEGEASIQPFERVMSRVVRGDGTVVVETKGMSVELPVEAFSNLATGQISSRDKTFRVRWAAVEPGYRIQAGLDLTHEKQLLAEYRQKLWLLLGAGLLASMIVGHRIGRHGIRRVEEIAATMRRISSATLDERVGTAGLPAELSALAATFNDMLNRLEDAFARLAQFSSDIAHELRTPINNLRGEVEVALAKARSPEEYREVLSSSLEESVRISRLIDSLLFLARSENPQTQIRREKIRVDEELEKIREFYEASASEAGVSLRVNAPAGLVAELDRTLFQRAIGNVIENSLKHTPRDGKVEVAAHSADDDLVVTVSDTGDGIPPAHVPKVFNRFHRVDTARSTSGVGLGLALVKSITGLHGGTARIDSELGHGTQVTLAFGRIRCNSLNST